MSKKKHDISDETIESVKQDVLDELCGEHEDDERSEWEEYEDDWDARDFL